MFVWTQCRQCSILHLVLSIVTLTVEGKYKCAMVLLIGTVSQTYLSELSQWSMQMIGSSQSVKDCQTRSQHRHWNKTTPIHLCHHTLFSFFHVFPSLSVAMHQASILHLTSAKFSNILFIFSKGVTDENFCQASPFQELRWSVLKLAPVMSSEAEVLQASHKSLGVWMKELSLHSSIQFICQDEA